MTRPQLWIVAGPNGAGKSTLVDAHLRGRLPVVNPDVIAAEHSISPLAAARIALAQRTDLMETQISFLVETTLSGHSEVAMVEQARARMFKVNLVFVDLRDAGHNLARVRQRVARGGHDVPEADIHRRIERSRSNFPVVARLADRVLVFDNSQRRRRLMFASEGGRVKFRNGQVPAWLAAALDGLPPPTG